MNSIATWLSLLVTFLAVVVALFKKDIRYLWYKPKLTAKIRVAAPDCHKTQLTMLHPSSRQIVQVGDCYYFRLWIQNDGRERAEKVQVFVASLMRKHADGKYKEEAAFLPMNLRWAHSTTPEIYAEAISPGMGKHCDLGHIVDPSKRDSRYMDSLSTVSEGQTIFELDLEVRPNTRSHLLAPGDYVLVLKLAAANTYPVEKRLRLVLKGEWFAEETKMFSDGVGIELSPY